MLDDNGPEMALFQITVDQVSAYFDLGLAYLLFFWPLLKEKVCKMNVMCGVSSLDTGRPFIHVLVINAV